jgi:hypothetical protein
MSKVDKFHITASISIEGIFTGVQIVMTPAWGWILIALGGAYFIYALYRLWKSKKPLSPIEMQNEIKYRKKYLPKVRNSIGRMINRYESIVNTDTRLLDINEYYAEYPLKGWHFKRIEKLDKETAFEGYLWVKEVYKDNLVLRKIVDNDEELNEISIELGTLYAYVKDKKVRTYMKNFRKGLNVAYSYVVFNKLSINRFKSIPLKTKNEYEHKEKATQRVRDLQNQLNDRIKELIEGAEDEL